MEVRCMVVVRWVGLAAVMAKEGWEVAMLAAGSAMVVMMGWGLRVAVKGLGWETDKLVVGTGG